ncbi:MAG: amidase [Planctomycetales bacterium]|nr:amidase [Planctomycetales bacterium]
MKLDDHAIETLTAMSAAELAAGIAGKQFTSREVVQAHIDRIEATHEQLNAVVVPRFEQALTEADGADAVVRRGEPLLPLHGVPITVKEMFDVKGTPTTVGILARRRHVATDDAVMVRRLRNAGAIILGKTNVPQLALMIETDNPVYGRTNNPWNVERSPGGSSGGEAAIIAAGGSPLGLGSDGAGSIRQPAHACGICGFMPTSGRLSVEGHWSFRGFPPGATQPGPMARTADDIILAMQILDDTTRDTPGNPERLRRPATPALQDAKAVPIDTLRVGVVYEEGYIPTGSSVRRAVRTAAEALKGQCLSVEEVQIPDGREVWDLFLSFMNADGGYFARQALAGTTADWRIAELASINAIPNVLRSAGTWMMRSLGQRYLADALRAVPRRRLSMPRYLALFDRLTTYRKKFDDLFEQRQLDLLLCPVNSVPAVPHGCRFANYSIIFSMFVNLLGLPAGTVPVTRVAERDPLTLPTGRDRVLRDLASAEANAVGLPIGVQLIGRKWYDEQVLAIMSSLQSRLRSDPDYPQCPVG